MELNPEIYVAMGRVDWFSHCGLKPPEDLSIRWQQAPDVSAAIESMLSLQWRDVATEAESDLTGYLAGHHYAEYGSYWNKLARASREKMQQEVMPRVHEALAAISAEAIADKVLLDLNRIALHSAYRKRFHRVPDFFQRLFVVYQRGHLPCGWIGDLDSWPEGQIIVY